jgi:hypothetical protein
MKKYKTQFYVLDDFGDVIRIQSYKPQNHEYKRVRICIYDDSDVEEAPF